jgi:16S rRNA (cytidine1402-2'-O)-methyltransferase
MPVSIVIPEIFTETPRAGCLYLVGTPIGNLEDITLRALRVLKEADLIACEDTRHTLKLLNHFEIRKRLISYREHNEHIRAPELVAKMEAGLSIALVSDAGMPVVSDPGERLVRLAIERGIAVVPVPGPSAFTAALVASGLPVGEFLFAGFLPAQQGKRLRALASLAAESRTLIFYEAPHRIAAMLEDARAAFGNRPAVIAREITKLHEEFLRGSLDELAAKLAGGKMPGDDAPAQSHEGAARRGKTRRAAVGASIRGEITVLIAPASVFAPALAFALAGVSPPATGGSLRTNADRGPRNFASPAEADAAAMPEVTLTARVLAIQTETGLSHKAALKQAAREFGLPRRAAYQRLLDERSDGRPDGGRHST